MDRVSTASQYSAILAGLTTAQGQLSVAQAQSSSGKLASDLKGYASTANALTATQTVKSRLDAYVDAGSALSDRLDAQAQALDGVSSAGAGARQAVFNALATNAGGTVMQELQGWFQQASDALNTNYQGQYLFSGGQPDTPPVKALSVTDLPTTPAPFQNGTLKSATRVDDNLSIQTGQLASDVGQPLFDVMKSVVSYVQTTYPATGQFPSPLSNADTAFLQSTLGQFDAASATVSGAVAQNGVTQSRVAAAQARITDQQTAATTVIGNIADIDPAKAITNLQLAQVALQASAQVFQTLQGSSLLSVLSATS